MRIADQLQVFRPGKGTLDLVLNVHAAILRGGKNLIQVGTGVKGSASSLSDFPGTQPKLDKH